MRFFVQAKPFPVGDTQSFLAKTCKTYDTPDINPTQNQYSHYSSVFIFYPHMLWLFIFWIGILVIYGAILGEEGSMRRYYIRRLFGISVSYISNVMPRDAFEFKKTHALYKQKRRKATRTR